MSVASRRVELVASAVNRADDRVTKMIETAESLDALKPASLGGATGPPTALASPTRASLAAINEIQ